jgi:hypothetical protein
VKLGKIRKQTYTSIKAQHQGKSPLFFLWLLPWLVSLTLLAIGITAINTKYTGTIILKFGADGGSLKIIGQS